MEIESEPNWHLSKNTKAGETTFKLCGWCDHRGGGLHRYNCMVSGSCNLLDFYNNSVKWNTACKFKNMGKMDVQCIISSKEHSIKELKSRIKRIKTEIITLSSMTLLDIPVQPDNRKYNHFNVEDEVYVWDGKSVLWKHGTVVYGYRHHDGCVSFHFDNNCICGKTINIKKMKKETDGKIFIVDMECKCSGCGYHVPTVILKTEYEYFANHPVQWIEWIMSACEQEFNGYIIDPVKIIAPGLSGQPGGD